MNKLLISMFAIAASFVFTSAHAQELVHYPQNPSSSAIAADDTAAGTTNGKCDINCYGPDRKAETKSLAAVIQKTNSSSSTGGTNVPTGTGKEESEK